VSEREARSGKHSGLWFALVSAWLARALGGWVIALPVSLSVSQSGALASPAGDRVLFEAEALWLAELLRRDGANLLAALRASAVLLSLGLLLRACSSLLLYTAIAEPRPLLEVATRALTSVPRWLVLGGAELLARVLLVLLGLLLAASVDSLAFSKNELWLSLPELLVLLTITLTSGVLMLLADVMRVGLVLAPRVGLRRLFDESLSRLRLEFSAFFGSFLALCGAAALVFALAARAVEWLDVGQPGAYRVAAVFGVHQATLLTLVGIEYVWARWLFARLRPDSAG